MSDLLEAAASALGTPTALVQRSAAARAAANGTTTDEILTAWAGGSTVATAPPPPESEPETPPAPEPEPEEPEETEVAVLEPPTVVDRPVAEPEPEPAEEEVSLDPVPIALRLRTAVRIGAWIGAALGVIGFLVAGSFWAPSAVAPPESGPAVIVSATPMLIGAALVSLVFGAIVASMSRAATSWANPAMELSTSKSSTAWAGAAIGLVLGVAAGAALTGGFGTPVEGSEGQTQLPVLATLVVLVVGGAVLGAITAAIPQALGTPVAMAEDPDEVATIRTRLRHAIGVPVAGLVLLLLLVLPFAFALIQSNHLVQNGAALIAILTAGGILGFAALAGSKPHMRITFGELMVAVIGIATVLAIILAVFLFQADESHEEEPSAEPEAAVVLVV